MHRRVSGRPTELSGFGVGPPGPHREPRQRESHPAAEGGRAREKAAAPGQKRDSPACSGVPRALPAPCTPRSCADTLPPGCARPRSRTRAPRAKRHRSAPGLQSSRLGSSNQPGLCNRPSRGFQGLQEALRRDAGTAPGTCPEATDPQGSVPPRRRRGSLPQAGHTASRTSLWEQGRGSNVGSGSTKATCSLAQETPDAWELGAPTPPPLQCEPGSPSAWSPEDPPFMLETASK